MYAKKSLGQHFLKCVWVVSTLIKAAEVGPQDTVLEIGPGAGILTRALARRAKRVVAVEKDERLADELKKRLREEKIHNVEIVADDILKIYAPGVRKVVANIPYYLTSRLLRLLLEKEPRPQTIVLTIQKEVAERIIAGPPHMNLLALSVQAYGKPEIIKKVPASCFSPKPKVDSAVIKIAVEAPDGKTPGVFPSTPGVNSRLFFKIIRLAFSQKRKTLVNTLGKHFGKRAVEDALKKINVDPTARPEELSLQEWEALIAQLV